MAWDGLRKLGLRKKRDMPGGLWMRCPDCGDMVYRKDVQERLKVCPQCNYHFEISAQERIAIILDAGSFQEKHAELESGDPLDFVARRSYEERLKEAQELTGLREACVVGLGRVDGKDLVLGVTDPRFLRGSMGSVVGEKITRAVELATDSSLPFVFVSGSGGGARMDEGVFSLMQMAKTSAALARYHERGGYFISVLTNPTMGGAMASFAALGDIVIAEPKALIGFAGPNVVKNTLKVDLPKGFQTSEFLLEHGFLDRIVARPELRRTITALLDYGRQERRRG